MPKGRHWTCRLWFGKKPLLTNGTRCTCPLGEEQERGPSFSVVNGSLALLGEAAGTQEEPTSRDDLFCAIYFVKHITSPHLILRPASTPILQRKRPKFRRSKQLSPGHRIWTWDFDFGAWILKYHDTALSESFPFILIRGNSKAGQWDSW